MQKEAVIILAGGSGKRMGLDFPKQFLPLQDKPIVVHTIEKFLLYNPDIQVILVLPEAYLSYWHEILDTYAFDNIITVIGGKERFFSAKNGFNYTNAEKIAIHDAVRPFIDRQIIEVGFKFLDYHDVAVPVILPKSSYRIVENEVNKAIDRNKLRIVQTPQFFRRVVLQKVFSLPYDPLFTDEATAAQKAGYEVYLFPGSEKNIKITTPFDLKLAHLLINE